MKHFQFKLQTVLDVKKKQEEILQSELAQLQELFQLQTQLLQQLEAKQAFYQTKLRGGQQEQLQLSTIQAHLEYLAFIGKEIAKQEEELALIAEELEAKRLDLVEAAQDCQLLEGLKEKERAGYLAEFRREEQNFLDELGQMGFARKEAGLEL